jgi:hypothetical protein
MPSTRPIVSWNAYGSRRLRPRVLLPALCCLTFETSFKDGCRSRNVIRHRFWLYNGLKRAGKRLRATESVAPPLENNTSETGDRSLVQLVKACLRFDSGLDAAVDLLLADSVYKLDMSCRDDLILCFHETLQRCPQSNHLVLTERMKTLAQQPGWDGLSWQWNPGDGAGQDQLHV